MASPGAMRERLRILTRTDTTDDHGGRSIAWSTLDTVYGELMPSRASERVQQQQMQALIDYRFRVRVRSDLTPKMRAEWRPSWLGQSTPKTLEIHGIVPDTSEPWAYALLECGEVAS